MSCNMAEMTINLTLTWNISNLRSVVSPGKPKMLKHCIHLFYMSLTAMHCSPPLVYLLLIACWQSRMLQQDYALRPAQSHITQYYINSLLQKMIQFKFLTLTCSVVQTNMFHLPYFPLMPLSSGMCPFMLSVCCVWGFFKKTAKDVLVYLNVCITILIAGLHLIDYYALCPVF